MAREETCLLTAVELTAMMKAGRLSAVEVMGDHLARIERINPLVNAIVTLDAARALDLAAEADERRRRGEPLGPLHGLPVAHKDLIPTRGMRTTFGAVPFRDHVPDQDALIVERFRTAGAICIGKTNTPEFGAGSQTFNAVFGATRNPWDTTRTCGGSSGGAAVALACGMLPIADGSDMGGSLRNPASFCNVVGLRPSPGVVPSWPTLTSWFTLPVLGPMARTVADIALILSAVSGPDPRCPIALNDPPERFARPLDRDFNGTRVAWSADLGMLPVDPRVTAAITPRLSVFADLGCAVDQRHPDFSGADEVFKVLRAWSFELAYADLLREQRAVLKDTVVWNIEAGSRLSGPQIGRAERLRTALYQRVREFMETYEFLLLPVSQVPPFDVDQPWVREIDGTPMATYIDWMKSCYFISAIGLPAISVPCGFTPEGLPVGIQIVGRPRDDFGVLQLARAFEKATGTGQRRPPMTLIGC